MVTQKQAIVSCALWLAYSAPSGNAFSARSLLFQHHDIVAFRSDGRNNNNKNSALMMAGFPPPMDGGGGSSGMGGPPGMGGMGGPPGMGGPSMGRRGPGMGGPSMGGPPGMGQRSMGGPPGMGQRSMGGRGMGPGMGGPSMGRRGPGMGQPSMGRGPGGGRQQQGGGSYNANNPPGGPFNVPNAGNTSGEPRARGLGPDARGLGALASGVSTPMDKYGNNRSRETPTRRFGGYNNVGGGPGGPDPRFDQRSMGGPGPRGGGFDERGGGPPPRDRDDGRPNNLRYEEKDYGEYVTNLRSTTMGGRDRDGGGPPGGGDYRDLEDEVERLRKENALLKRSCQDFMNNFNELSNRLFDVDETLKKVAKVFPSEDEMESLEWLLRR